MTTFVPRLSSSDIAVIPVTAASGGPDRWRRVYTAPVAPTEAKLREQCQA